MEISYEHGKSSKMFYEWIFAPHGLQYGSPAVLEEEAETQPATGTAWFPGCPLAGCQVETPE